MSVTTGKAAWLRQVIKAAARQRRGYREPFALLWVYYCYRRRTCENTLVERAAHGDQEAFLRLWEDHHAAVMATALRLCHQSASRRDHAGCVSAGLAWAAASARQLKYTLGRLLLARVVLLAALTLIVCWMHHVLLVGIPLALTLYVVVAWCWQRQARSLAFHADILMVNWLGRSHACSGLHALADRSQAPRRRRWSEPSLAERIKRVCGAGVEARENRLTLVG